MLLAPDKLPAGAADQAARQARPDPGWVVVAHSCHSKHAKCKCPSPTWRTPCQLGCACGTHPGPIPPPFVSAACGGYPEEITIGGEAVYQTVIVVHTKCLWTRAECACKCHTEEPAGEIELELI